MKDQITLSQDTLDGLTEIAHQFVDASQQALDIFADYWTDALAPAVQTLLDACSVWFSNLPPGTQLFLENYPAKDYFITMLDTGEDAEAP